MSDYEPEIYDIFRGATKPTMLFGVPMLALGIAALPFAIIGLWSFMIFGFVGLFLSLSPFVVVYLIMKDQTKQDDQQLKMFGLNFKETIHTLKNRLPITQTDNKQTIRIIPPKPMRSDKFMEY
ncbi:MAG: VirB3 family type IV secretion system protein [Neisseriaceae bacterium]|nr:VirB3 family type IV secretion system protein [Neisseriaceae bacterium]